MSRLYLALACMVFGISIAAQPALSAEPDTKPAPGKGNLLTGAVYKQSGISRDGVITIFSDWSLLSSPPVYRYDSDILRGRIDEHLYSYQMADIAEIDFYPIDRGEQAVNVRLRNGLIQRLVLSTEKKTVLGFFNIRVREVKVVTDKYGEDVIPAGDVYRIVFSDPSGLKDDMAGLLDMLGKALYVGKRDGLVDDAFHKVLDNIQSKMKAAAKEEKKQ